MLLSWHVYYLKLVIYKYKFDMSNELKTFSCSECIINEIFLSINGVNNFTCLGRMYLTLLDVFIMLTRVCPLPLNRNGTSRPCRLRKTRSRLARSGTERSRCWQRRRGWRSLSRPRTHSTTSRSASLFF